MNKIWLYGRILQTNSLSQSQVIEGTRESNHNFWLTHQNQKRNHKKFEDATVSLGISLPPVIDEENEREGNVVFEIDGEDTKKCDIF